MLKGFLLKPETKQTLHKHIDAIDLTAGNCLVDIEQCKNKRSIEQNSLSHSWYGQLAKELPEDDELGWKCYCKLHHGVPILRAEDEEFRKVYDSAIKGLTYEQKLSVMKILPVTSIMKTTQLSKYLEAVQIDFQQRGVYLEFPQ